MYMAAADFLHLLTIYRTYALTEIHNYAHAMPVMLLCLINSAIILLNNCRCT